MQSIYDLTEAEYHAFLTGKSLGGTAAGAIIGVNRYKNPAQVYDDLMHEQGGGRPDNQHMARGRALEPVALRMYAEMTGQTVEPLARCQHPSYPFLHATPDAAIVPDGLLEVKVPMESIARHYAEEGIDPSYYAQAQHYLNVTGRAYAKFAILNPNAWELYVLDCPRDQAFIDQLEAAMIRFWRTYVLTRTRPPEVVDPEALVVPSIPGSAIEHTEPEWVEALTRLRAAKEAAALATRQLELSKAQVQALMGSTEVVTVPGVGRVSWKASTSRHLTIEHFEAQEPIDRMKFLLWAREQGLCGGDIRAMAAIADELKADIREFQNVTEGRTMTTRFS